MQRLLLAALWAAAFVHAESAAAARRLGTLEFSPCGLKAPGMPLHVDAFCTDFPVPENPDAPEGRKIELAIALVPSRADEALPDPVFMLAGGPGQGAREAFPGAAAAFRDLRARRHIILVDQRGTGDSHKLACALTEAEQRNASAMEDPATMRAFAERCRRELEAEADLSQYTTSIAVRDLDAVRAAIGAEQINLVGISYGTRVGLEYLRRFPERTRTLTLDGVVPPELMLGSEHAANLEAALALQFARCTQDPVCSERFGSPRANLDALFERLRSETASVTLRDPVSGVSSTERFGPADLAGVVRLFAYSPGQMAMLPLGLAEASAGRYDTLLAQSRMVSEVLGESIALGMHFSVSCAEDAPGLAVDPAQAESTLGNALVETLLAACAVWPRGAMPQDFHAALVSDKPVLLLSGELDPVTPPRYGEQVLKTLAKGRHLIARGTGHNALPRGCIPKLVSLFVQDADAVALDASCLERLDYTPPFAGFYGWDP
jgi:pimeloyl-ACP methyl ester carboxylesterase